MKKAIDILVRRDGITTDEASEMVAEFETEARSFLNEALDAGADPFSTLEELGDLCMMHLGLEPDFAEHLLHELV